MTKLIIQLEILLHQENGNMALTFNTAYVQNEQYKQEIYVLKIETIKRNLITAHPGDCGTFILRGFPFGEFTGTDYIIYKEAITQLISESKRNRYIATLLKSQSGARKVLLELGFKQGEELLSNYSDYNPISVFYYGTFMEKKDD